MTDTPAAPPAITPWIERGVLDAELGALTWLLVEAGVPLLVAGTPGSGRAALRDAVAAFLPADSTRTVLRWDNEDFEWLPEAVELGWHRDRPARSARPRSSGGLTAMVAVIDDRPGGIWGEQARIAIRALSVGYGMLATVRGDRLEDVFERLGAPPVEASEDELSRLGLVLVLGELGGRVTAAHYLRPVARDVHGHVQRLPPAVVATWDEARHRFEHFAWGIGDELADRVELTPLDFEREQARRAETLATGASGPRD
jgi:hypothetical protein